MELLMLATYLAAQTLAAQTATPATVEAEAGNEYDVRLLDGAGVRTMRQLDEALSRSWAIPWKDSFTVRPGTGPRKWLKIKSCGALNKIDAQAAKTRPDDDWDYLVARAAWCRALSAVKRASPAKRSFLGDVLSARNPATYLPASVVAAVNAGESPDEDREPVASKEAQASIPWSQLDPSLKLAEAQAKDRIELEGKDYLAFVSLYAVGDFDGDGVADVLLQVGIRPFDASQGDAAFFVLTRPKAQGLLRVLETFR